jgi:TetR/AcrR family transcriptional regulator
MDETKDRIAAIALELFSRQGYESVGVNEIAAVAGIGKPSLYYHFGNKEGLLAAIVEGQGAALLELTGRGAEYRHDLGMNLTCLFRDTVAFACANQAFFRLLLRLFASAPETPGFDAGASLRTRLVGTYVTLFHRASHDHGNMRRREGIYAETFWGLIESCAKLAMNKALPMDDHTQFRIVHQYMHGIFS